ncbi:MAG: hypothetical protein WA813_25005 [Beijerinckiaceae bacterium]
MRTLIGVTLIAAGLFCAAKSAYAETRLNAPWPLTTWAKDFGPGVGQTGNTIVPTTGKPIVLVLPRPSVYAAGRCFKLIAATYCQVNG